MAEMLQVLKPCTSTRLVLVQVQVVAYMYLCIIILSQGNFLAYVTFEYRCRPMSSVLCTYRV